MSLANLTSADLRPISILIKKKESLSAQIAEIDKDLNSFSAGSTFKGKKRAGRPEGKTKAPKKRAKGKRGALKEQILAELKTAGKIGVSVKDLAAKMDAKYANIYAWFMATGSKVKGIKKVGPAKYALKN